MICSNDHISDIIDRGQGPKLSYQYDNYCTPGNTACNHECRRSGYRKRRAGLNLDRTVGMWMNVKHSGRCRAALDLQSRKTYYLKSWF